ncbi:MAG TPA: peptidylprolyl isomerase [Phycisphaerae bacterium]|nr:peptidylprolyl isomerase [Phycisphaerae bacterium]
MTRLISLLAVLAVGQSLFAQDEQKGAEKKAAATQPVAKTDDGLHPRVKMETTLGDIILELDAEKAPITVQNFIRYAEDEFYEGTIFHRVIATFMIQGGGFTVEMDQKQEGLHPPIKNEWQNGLKNVRGTIAMARTNQADSATAQFFINVVDNVRLDQPSPRGGNAAYCVFGQVVAGLDVVDTIRDTKLHTHPKYPAGAVTPVEPVVIKSVKLIGKYDRAKGAELTKAWEAELAVAEKAAKAAAEKAQAAQEKELQEFIKTIEQDTGGKVEKTESGLMYIVLKEGNGPSPQPTDTVEVHYTGWLLDGKKFESSLDSGQPITFPLNGVIPGWTEGVAMMKVGGKRKLIIPPELGYRGQRKGKIPPNSYLVFEVELLSIK